MQINAKYEGLKKGKLIFFIIQGTVFSFSLALSFLSQAHKLLEGVQHPQCGHSVLKSRTYTFKIMHFLEQQLLFQQHGREEPQKQVLPEDG